MCVKFKALQMVFEVQKHYTNIYILSFKTKTSFFNV
jgi:hypothetical protein